MLRNALESVEAALASAGVESELVVVDNASRDDSRSMVAAEFPRATLVELDDNLGFPTAVNAGIDRTRGEWVLLLNNDATIAREALINALEPPPEPDVGAIAMQMRFSARPDLVNSAGIGLDTRYVAFDRLLGTPVDGEASRPAEVFGACGGAALYRRAMLEDVGGLDSRIFLYLDDVDVAWRARMAGWRAEYRPAAVVWHEHSATTRHGSGFKYFHVGRSRMRVLARNADRRHLLRHGPAIVSYELAYVAFAAVADRTLAPARGRLAGLREWRALRREGARARREIPLDKRQGFLAALRRRQGWLRGGTPPQP